jgi:hypothetical protein
MSGDPTAAVPASHDPMCPIARETWCIWPGDRCGQCRLIASVRDDERSWQGSAIVARAGYEDGYDAAFRDARNAVEAALSMVKALREASDG